MKKPKPQSAVLWFIVGPRNSVAPYYGCAFTRKDMLERVRYYSGENGVEFLRLGQLRAVKFRVEAA